MNAAAKAVDEATAAMTLVYGLGSTGLSAARYLKRAGVPAVFFDSRNQPPGLSELGRILPEAEVLTGDLPADRYTDFDRVFVSPGIPDSDAVLNDLRSAGIPVVSDIEIFVAEAAADFVAVTGSNGKSTVTTLIAQMCEAAGRRALPGGNLGHAALDLLAEDAPDVYVLELSSFQLQRTPHLPASVSVLLNVSPDHLDWHRSIDEYRAAKYRVFDECEAAVFNRDDATARARLNAQPRKIGFGLDAPDSGQYGIVADGGVNYLARGRQRLLSVNDLALVGRHNWANSLAALAAIELLGLDISAALPVLTTFHGLPHRMQFVRELDGVRYINDSKATNVGASIAAVQSVDGPVVLLAGGLGKGGDFASLAAAVTDRLRGVVVYGEDAARIGAAFSGTADVHHAPDLVEALAAGRNIAMPGDTVLLAPACASFDQFSNYMARGDAFCEAVKGLTG